MKTDSVNVRALCRAYDLGKAEGIEKGRADAIDECVDILNDSFPLVDNMDIIFGFKCACERLEQFKEQKNE